MKSVAAKCTDKKTFFEGEKGGWNFLAISSFDIFGKCRQYSTKRCKWRVLLFYFVSFELWVGQLHIALTRKVLWSAHRSLLTRFKLFLVFSDWIQRCMIAKVKTSICNDSPFPTTRKRIIICCIIKLLLFKNKTCISQPQRISYF